MKRRAVLAMTSALALSACGFQLRGANGQANLPFKTIYIGVPETSQLGAELRRNIRASGETTIVSDPKAAQAIVEVLSETRDIAILLNAQGRPREHTLYYKLRFRVTNPKGAEMLAPTEITLKRDLSFNEAQAIAKEKEEEMLYRDMQTDLVQQIMRRLAVLKPT
ncbi:LPS assembly lipoprotein LptE [Noviherbaspirillum sp.]|jgi:LPS-assembly lipoprotein|uniref:LPS-assembly lipoprotein LptE n=1 Tax=Noviherbaspirillum sp. TaxID=1926288 RepID=UPI0025D769E5|nr:LPS assembly lipoprotein LptE [Noviherbaspirillum sp.]